MSERMVELEVLRYNPETDSEPHFQRYTVTCREEWVVLDALNHIKETIDPTLSYRWSCHMAVCGSCGMMINGEPKLACKAFLRDYEGVIRVEPLRALPDRARPGDGDRRLHGQADARQALPDPEGGEGARARASTGRRRRSSRSSSSTRMCINCMLCYAACPEYGLIPKFIGPAAIALAHRYNQDSRDGGRDAAPGGDRGHRRASGNARSSAPARRSVPSTSIRRARSSRSRSRARWTGTRST